MKWDEYQTTCRTWIGIASVSDGNHEYLPTYCFVSSYRNWVARSGLRRKRLKFIDTFDVACYLKLDIEKATFRKTFVYIYTDRLSLFDVMTKATVTSEKKGVMIAFSSVKSAYNNDELGKRFFTRSQYEPADALTRHGTASMMYEILKTSRTQNPLEQ